MTETAPTPPKAPKGKATTDAPATPEADVLVYNGTRGIRQCVAIVGVEGDPEGKRSTQVPYRLLPGLNLVPASVHAVLSAEFDATAGVSTYPEGLDGMHASSAKVLIDGTGSTEVLGTLQLRCKSEAVLVAINSQIKRIASEGARAAQREAQRAHQVGGN